MVCVNAIDTVNIGPLHAAPSMKDETFGPDDGRL
jgi:hypothetical protein